MPVYTVNLVYIEEDVEADSEEDAIEICAKGLVKYIKNNDQAESKYQSYFGSGCHATETSNTEE